MLINFLTDAIINMDCFRDDLKQIFLYKESPEKLVAVSNHNKMLLLYRVVSDINIISEFDGFAYLGAVQYLRSLLSSDLMKNGRLEIEYIERDKKKFASSMRFISQKINANFECTNPEVIIEKERRNTFEKPKDFIIFNFTKDMFKEFNEVSRMNTPKADTRLFTLMYDGKYVRAIFGSGKHTTTFSLTDQVDGSKDMKIHKMISLDRFKSMVKLTSENNGQASFHDKAFWVDFKTSQAFHTIVTPTLRER
jgi:hypothetical protein